MNNTSLKETFKENQKMEKEKLKNLSFGQKIEYIWTYYKIPIFAVILVIIIAVSIIRSVLTPNPESAMYVLAVNSDPFYEESDSQKLFDSFLKSEKLDPSDYTVTLNTSIQVNVSSSGDFDNPQMYSVMMTLLMAGEVDVLATDEAMFTKMAELGYVAPLSSYLSNEEIASCKERIIYATDPETKKKTAFGIIPADSSTLGKSSLFSKKPVIGVIYRAPHLDLSEKYVKSQIS